LNKAYMNPALKAEEEDYLERQGTNAVNGNGKHSPLDDEPYADGSKSFVSAYSRQPSKAGSESPHSFYDPATSPGRLEP
jgi:hypothetical protein